MPPPWGPPKWTPQKAIFRTDQARVPVCLDISRHLTAELYRSRGHKARGQVQGQPFRGQTVSRPRTGMLKAKDQGHKCKCSPKKRSSQKFFRRSQEKKRSSQKFFKRSSQKNVFQKVFQALHRILTIQKILLSWSRGQANF